MTVEERIEAADRRKVDGNELFKEGKIAEAMQQYEMVTRYPPFTTFAAENTMIVFKCLNLKFLYHGEKIKKRKKERIYIYIYWQRLSLLPALKNIVTANMDPC